MAEGDIFGGVTATEIEEFAQQIGLPPTEAGASLTSKFSRQVANLVAARSGKGEAKSLSVFLRSESLYEDASKCESVEVPLLRNAADPISGRVWISTATIASAFEIKLKWHDQTALFQSIREIGFGSMAALVVDFRSDMAVGTLYRNGLDDSGSSERVIFDEAPISSDALKAVLDRFYEKSLRTPALVSEAHAKRVWQDASKGIPEFRPEERIQGRLSDILKSWFSRFDVRPESTTQDGRADIVIYSKTVSHNNLPAIVNHWVLELKALCDMTSTGSALGSSIVIDAVTSGLEQAVAYRFRLNAVNAAVCCYDMLKNDQGDTSIFSHVETDAAASNVHLWRWYLFRGTAASRSAQNYMGVPVR